MSRRSLEAHRDAVARHLADALLPRTDRVGLDLLADPASDLGDLGDLVGRILAAPAVAGADAPPFDNSQLDGYAVRAADVRAGTPLPLAPEIAAGSVAAPLPAGHAAPIMTGAPLPPGADAVVAIERTEGDGFAAHAASGRVVLLVGPSAGDAVRTAASDLRRGDEVLPAGARLGPAALGALAAGAVDSVDLVARPRVAIVSTGRELAAGVRDANGPALAAAVLEAGGLATRWLHADDEPAAFARLLEDAARGADVVVTTGGVSRGTHEVVREALADRGEFVSVGIQPGGPQGLATVEVDGRDVPVLCFPGNPVSALVSFELLLRPLLRAAAGMHPAERATERRPLAEPVDSPPELHQVRRGIRAADGTVRLVGGASSHLIGAYARADALVHLPPGLASAPAGTPVDIWRIDD
ncbi:gephyrin-like molybdotransferase Glp [Agromyces sp. MMS24-JH15]|uniref:molybdopterin molybdotransferase MoeA n=1 Tax=Agromyces sp. MMS24-JH15 TaxID=3243765 RepID=UPI003749E0B4